VLNPELLYSHQGKYNEFVPGAMLRYIFNPEKNNTASIGFYYRAKDAFISRLGYTYGLTTAGISYDLNTSKFIAATNRRGAFELYITHIIRKNRPFVAKKRVCPVYM
ncbi:MAG: type IX secretion system membrane protein PorP/SprF, partial [Bacteroidia bacterium]